MKKIYGYTLIEILVALTIFSILATTTGYILYNSTNTRNLVNAQAAQLNELQLAFIFFEKDIKQMIERSVYINDLQLQPPFIGNDHYIEFTRDGIINTSKQPFSSLRRIAYICKNNSLFRRSWYRTDTPNKSQYSERKILANLENCSFAFLSQSHQILHKWQPYALQQNQQKASLPLAIQFNFNILHWGKMNLLFSIPISLYASV